MTDPRDDKKDKLNQAVQTRIKGLGLDALFHLVDISQKDSDKHGRGQPLSGQNALLPENLQRHSAHTVGMFPALRAAWSRVLAPRTARHLTIAISGHAIKILETQNTKDTRVITGAQYVPIPHQISGSPENSAAFVTQTLTQLFAQRDMEHPRISLIIPRCDTVVKFLGLPSTDPLEIRKMIEFEIEHHLPFPRSEAETDYRILQRDASHSQLLLGAVHQKALALHLSIFERLNIFPRSVGISSLSLFQALGPATTAQGISVQVSIGSQFMDINVVQDGQLVVTRGVPGGSRQLTEQLAKALNVSFENAESIKKEHGIILVKKETSAVEQAVSAASCRWTDQVIAEVQRTIQSFQMNIGMNHIDRLILTGGGSRLKNLNEYLKEKLRVPVVVPLAPPSLTVRRDQAIFAQHLQEFFPLLGMAWDKHPSSAKDALRLNLIPKKIATSRRRQQERVQRNVRLVAGIIAAGIFFLLPWLVLSTRDRQAQDLADQIARLQPEVLLAKGLKEKIQTVEDYLSFKTSCMTALREISLRATEDIIINKFDFEQNHAVVLTGEASSHASAVNLSQTLAESDIFANATLKYTRKKDRQANTVDFEIVCTFKTPGDPS